jgi:tetratricopeptide (TPR) repeat protein
MRPGSAWLGSIGLVLLLVAVQAPVARAQAISQGFDLERQGRIEQAAALYASVLRGDPANLPALLGLERVLPGLGRLRELLPLARRALATDSGAAIRGLAVRTFVVLDETDSAAALGRRWAAQRPHDPAPWREWAIALEDQQRFDEARNVLMEGRRALATPGALAIELAELGQRTGDWQAAALEWAAAVSAIPPQLPNAASQLEDAPADQRDRVAHALTVPDAPVIARRLAAELLLGWGQPERAWETFAATLETATPETAFALRRFADRAGGAAPGVRRVRGLALARLADLVPGPLAARARAEAARALLDAGDRAAARSVLAKLASDPNAPADAQALAQGALVEALIADGQLDSATAGLARLDAERRGSGEERERLRHALVGAWIAMGRLDRAETTLGADSSVDALALRGWVELYRGDLKSAVASFRHAGPYAGDRDAATARTTALALLEQIDAERSPELGAALLALARGDSSGAVAGLRRAAGRLPGARGRPDVLLRAAQIAARQGGAHEALAAELLAEVVRSGGRGAAAPAAELEWARLLLRQARPADAIAHLEHLILTYPGSAVVPEARRELERARGAIPRS